MTHFGGTVTTSTTAAHSTYFYNEMASEFSNSTDVPDHSYQPCRYENVYIRLRPVMRVVLVIAAIVTATTLLMIACHRRVRKQHNIFRFNIVFANLLFVGCECLWEVTPDEFWEVLIITALKVIILKCLLAFRGEICSVVVMSVLLVCFALFCFA